MTLHRRPFFTAVGLKLSEISYAQIGGVFAIAYVTGKLAMPRNVILNAILLSAIVAFVAIPLFGWLSDRIGRKTMFYASSLFAMGFAFPIFWLLDTKDPLTITLTIVAAITFGQMVGFGVGASWYSELFTAPLRYSGASLGFQISGGLTPFAAATFMAWSDGATWPISVYLIVLAIITFVATMGRARNGGQGAEMRDLGPGKHRSCAPSVWCLELVSRIEFIDSKASALGQSERGGVCGRDYGSKASSRRQEENAIA
jgi:MFS transporter, MHS family, shikimate and dehydroshikimate transport protein